MKERECRELLSSNIKRFRNRLGLSQLNLALELGISPNFLSDIETGKKWVSPRTLAELANALHIEIHELFKPEEAVSKDITAIIEKCLNELSISLRQSVDQSIEQSLENIRKYYNVV
jgi:transcriptional regulator with XRE-family HTH domain